MREMYSNEIPLWMRWLGIWRVNRDSFDFKWGYFAPRRGFEFMVHRGGYFDRRYALSFCLGWGEVHIYMPFKTNIPETCDAPNYGIQIHGDIFWIHLGGKMGDMEQCDSKWITWELPYFSQIFEFHKVWNGIDWVLYDGHSEPYPDGRAVETHPYRYTLNSREVQNRTAAIYMERRQWHRKWLPFLRMTHTGIDVTFDDEVGERSGSWKGGCIGCGYNMLPSETMLETLRRMESERKF